MVYELTRSTAAQAVSPSHQTVDQLGTTGTNLVLLTGVAQISAAAEREGLAIVGMPSGFSGRVRVGVNETALLTDAFYPGPMVWHFEVKQGESVSIYPESDATVTVTMARK